MRRNVVLVIGVLAAYGVGCSKARDETQAAVVTAIAEKALADKGQHIDAAKMMAAFQDGKNNPTVTKRAIVNYKALVPFLPEAPAGWTATAVEGTTATVGVYQVSEASRRYTKGKSSLKLTITDMSQNPAVSMMALAFSVTEDSTTGFRKPYGAAGVTGSEKWTVASKEGEIDAMTKNQMIVALQGNSLDGPEVTRDFMGKVDLAKLGDLSP